MTHSKVFKVSLNFYTEKTLENKIQPPSWNQVSNALQNKYTRYTAVIWCVVEMDDLAINQVERKLKE